jgi:hypothetical protein
MMMATCRSGDDDIGANLRLIRVIGLSKTLATRSNGSSASPRLDAKSESTAKYEVTGNENRTQDRPFTI